MPKFERQVDVCEFCYGYFNEFMPKQAFNFGKKEKVTWCSCCGQSMCLDCQLHSMDELNWSILAQYWFTICRNCVVRYRRTTAFQEELEKEVFIAVETVKKTMSKNIYHLTKKRQWHLS